jgi:hypothetical protein
MFQLVSWRFTALSYNRLVAVHYPAGSAISWKNNIHIVGFLRSGHDFFSGQAFNKLTLTSLPDMSFMCDVTHDCA